MKYEFSQAPRVLIGRTGFAMMALLLLTLSGCGQQYEQASAPDDEAMKRALVEKKTADQAAQQYFLPKYYFDPQKKSPHVPNYFQGMDTVVVSPTEKQKDQEHEIDQLKTPVFQLLDKQTPEFVFADAVQSDNEILGRNTWMAWCGGNEGFWDWLATDSLGFIDLLKLIDSRQRTHRFQNGGLINEPGMAQNGTPDEFGLWLDTPNDADTVLWRRKYLQNTFAAINERKHESQRGLFDEPSSYRGNLADGYSTPSKDYSSLGSANHEQELKELTEEAAEYPPPGIYGISSGVVGLRLFPNPKFDAEARKKWDAKRYYTDEDYAADPKLVRPYRVGVACAYCHASFHPLNPPRDVTNPSWENVSGNIGAQYLRIRVAFGNLLKPDNYIYHLLDSQPPGTIDTSLIASDNINNPNTMNSVFALPQRALLSFRNPQENISIASGSLPSIWGNPDASISSDGLDKVPKFFQDIFQTQGLTDDLKKSNSHPPRSVPRILLDGSDSVGAYAALARVYLNIGMYWEQWIRIHRPVVGFKKQSPFTIADCEHHSVYWHATKLRVPALRDYFLKATPPMPLVAAVVGKRKADRLNETIRIVTPDKREAAAGENISDQISEAIASRIDQKKLKNGRKVFANNCIVCHSSIQPESSDVTLGVVPVPEQTVEQKKKFDQLVKRRKDSRAEVAKLNEFWEHDPGQWLRDEDYLTWAEHAVECQNFWRLNYLSTDYRIPITLVQTNAGRAMATNALDGAMWDDFASESYQHLPSVGAIDFFNPYLGKAGEMDQFTPRHKVGNGVPSAGGGPGYYRVPTLISIWATAPFLHNNSLGKFTNNPTIEGRMRAFDDGIRKLLWPAKRLESS